MPIWDIKERYKKARANDIIGNRGFFAAGNSPGTVNIIDYISISSTGNAVDFGDTKAATAKTSACSSSVRGVMAGGTAGTNYEDIQYITIASLGGLGGVASDFGNLTDGRHQWKAGASDNVRGIFAGGNLQNPGNSMTNIIDFITIASVGNASDFGDLSVARRELAGTNGLTRAIFAGGDPGSSPYNLNTIDYITMASAGDATDFGDLVTASSYMCGFANRTRAVFTAGAGNSGGMEHITIASTGNAADFGDLSVARQASGGTSNTIRGITGGGSGLSNVIDFVTITTLSNAADFGDLTDARTNVSSFSDCHPGIDQDTLQRPSVTYMPGSGKTLICGGQLSPGAGTVDIDTYNIPTLGNARNFGDLSKTASNGVGCASSYTRAVFSSGYYFTSPYYSTEMQAIEFATEGNVCDFGDTTQERYGHAYGNVGNTTRGLFMGGYAPSSPYIVNIIDYITIANMGNATDFGDLTNVKQSPAGASSNTRGLSLGGTTPSNINIIDYVTIASTGDASDFGDLTLSRSNCSGAASSVRAVAAGGGSPSNSDVIDYVTIASTGDASDFGDLTQAGKAACPGSNGTRAVFAGRHTPGKETTMDYITIASTGDAADFGDLKAAASEKGSASDSHGGLQS